MSRRQKALPKITEWHDGRPVARGILIQRHPRIPHKTMLEIICPLCGHLHWHTWDARDGFDFIDHRYAHCGRRLPEVFKAQGYFVGLDVDSAHMIFARGVPIRPNDPRREAVTTLKIQ